MMKRLCAFLMAAVTLLTLTACGSTPSDPSVAGKVPEESFVDPADKESLKQHVVTAQNIAPNTELKLTFAQYSDGTEASGVVDRQNIEEIELYVKRIANTSDSTD